MLLETIKKKNLNKINKQLKVFSFSGIEDPVTQFGKNIYSLDKRFKKLNIKHKYKIEGGTYINGKPILVRTVDSIDVSNLINNSVLDFQTGVFIDSMTTLPIIESYAIATYKLYRIEHGDSLTLLNDCFLGTRRVDIERPKHHW